MKPRREDLRRFFVRHGHSFYREHMRRTWVGKAIGRQMLRSGLVTVTELQEAGVLPPVEIKQRPKPCDPQRIEENFAIPGFHFSQPLNTRVDDALALKPSINMLLPSVKRVHMSGGPNTALIVAALLAERGERIRIITTDAATDGEEAGLCDHMDGLLGRPVRRDLIEAVDGFARTSPVAVGPEDIFFATAWWTAQIAKYASMSTSYNCFIYLIQDFEPILHEGSTFYLRALETYGLDHIPVINTRLLLDHLLRESAGRYADPDFASRALWFEPALDRKHYFPEPAAPAAIGGNGVVPKKTLLFYARPGIARRNLYEMGVMALRQAVADGHIDCETWDVWAMGETMLPVDLGKGVTLRPLPWMSFEDYAHRVRTADLLLSLMLSPHPSYPPLEMAASGKLAVTNSFSVKSSERLQALSPNILVAEPTAESIARTLGTAVGRVNAGLPSNDPTGRMALPDEWSASLSGVIDGLQVRLHQLRERRATQSATSGRPAEPRSDYEKYRIDALARRRNDGVYRQQPGLLSFLTTVHDTEPDILDQLAGSLVLQDGGTQFEWIIVDNGSSSEATRKKLAEIGKSRCVRLIRSAGNLGVIGGLRRCLEEARGRYVVPVDCDDVLARDCVNVMTRYLIDNDYPAALYSDEDRLDPDGHVAPFFKPDWDPVLLTQCPYIAQLCAVDRATAINLEFYSDREAEACHGWDSAIRLLTAGITPRHVPEVLYGWRATVAVLSDGAVDAAHIRHSQQHILDRLSEWRRIPHLRLVQSPFFTQSLQWSYRRGRHVPVSCASIAIHNESSTASSELPSIAADDVGALRALSDRLAGSSEDLIHLCWSHVTPDGDEWLWDAAGLLEAFPDAVMVGGILHCAGHIVDGPRVFGFGDGCDCPDRGRPIDDPGYSSMLWKAHSVSAVSSGHCVIRREFLLKVMPVLLAANVPLRMIGPWLGGLAAESGGRIVFSPFMPAVGAEAPEQRAPAAALSAFLSRFWSQLPDTRYYSRWLGLTPERAYREVTDKPRTAHLRQLQQRTLRYDAWLDGELADRGQRYPAPDAPAAVSVITPVYAGSDLGLLDELAASIRRQTVKVAEWILVINGPMPPSISAAIRQRADRDWGARLIVEPNAIGIVAALRMGLDAAIGDYVVPIDGDDLVTDDAVQILCHAIDRRNWPDFLYSDEDLLIGGRPAAPYLRGAYDPLLSLDNSTIWHLCAMKRETAIATGVYSDAAANWCQDWDSVSRMTGAGCRVEHIPEVLYHWRQHAGSTTNNETGDARSLDSVRHILERHIARLDRPERFDIKDWPEDRGGRELYIARKPIDLPDFVWFADRAPHPGRPGRGRDAILVYAASGVTIASQSVYLEAARLFDLHPRLAVLGGNVVNADGAIIDGCYLQNAKGDLEASWSGRSAADGGPFSLAMKTQRVALPGSALAFFRISALEAAGLWQLTADIGEAGAMWQLAQSVLDHGWTAGFSPLVRGQSLSELAFDRVPRWRSAAAVAPTGLVRYGLLRNYVI